LQAREGEGAVLDALEFYASALEDAAKPEDLGLFVTFAREYADGLHHGKEEQILLRAMVDAGHRSDAGPVAVFRREHEHGRELVRTLAELASRASAWSPDDAAAVREAAHEYVTLLRRHIEKEDAVLFPMAELELGSGGIERVQAEFEAFDADHAGPHLDRLVAIAESLAARYGRPSPIPRTPTPRRDACHELCNRHGCVYGPSENEKSPWRR